MKRTRIPLLACVLSLLPASLCFAADPSDATPASQELDPAAIEQGKATYAMFCLPCHGAENAGIDSPSNLFDQKWYHGEGRQGIERSIREGIVDKGMPGWGQMISDQEINAVLVYLLSFQNNDSSSHD